MRVLRIGEPSSKIGKDVLSALVSWGHGNAVGGGIALIGCRPPGHPAKVDAVVVTPRGVLAIVGVDLPNPTVRLEAPLDGPWLADSWRIPTKPGSVNPADGALGTAGAAVLTLQRALGAPLEARAVIAVGPYVGKVITTDADRAKGIRVLYPGPAALREISASLEGTAFTPDKVRGVVKLFEPDLPELPIKTLHEEGFTDAVSPRPGKQAVPQQVKAKRIPGNFAQTVTGRLRKIDTKSPAVRISGVAVVFIVVVTIIALFASGNPPAPQQPVAAAEGAQLSTLGLATDTDCVTHAYGDVHTWLQTTKCSGLTRSVLASTVNGAPTAVALSEVSFADAGAAVRFRTEIDQPGAGGITDLVADHQANLAAGISAPQSFDNSAYRSDIKGATVLIAQAVYTQRPSQQNDPTLLKLAADTLTQQH